MTHGPRMEDVFDRPSDAGFYELAPLYDFVYRRGFDYGRQAARVREERARESVLELACGTGLLADRLAEDGAYVGVDSAAPMLAVASERVDAPFVRGDARRVAFDRTFGAVAMLGRSSAHFDADGLGAVAAVARDHLREGAFVLDAHDRAKLEDGHTTEDSYESDRWVVVYRGRSTTTGGGWCTHEYGYEVTDRETGERRTFEGSYEMRFWGAGELRELLRRSGFGTVTVTVEDGAVRAAASPA